MKGKKVCVGSQGTSWLFLVNAVLEHYGITLNDITPYYMNYAECSEALANGDIDAAFQVGGYPIAGIQQSAATTPFYFISLPEDVIETMPSARRSRRAPMKTRPTPSRPRPWPT